MIVGGYELHLYCDLAGCIKYDPPGADPMGEYLPAQFHADTYWKAKKLAREAGWYFFKSKAGAPPRVRCPDCSGKRKPLMMQFLNPKENAPE